MGIGTMTEEEKKAAENFQNMLKALIAAERKSLQEQAGDEPNQDRAGAEAFIEELQVCKSQMGQVHWNVRITCLAIF